MNRPVKSVRAPVSLMLGMALLPLIGTIPAAAMETTDLSGQWQFRVLLDGDEIGYHSFELVNDGELDRVTSEASFTVRFLFFDAYRYQHRNEELWRDDCLQRMDARTEVNGKALAVRGERVEDGFLIATGDEREVVSDCVMSFAYWKPEFLDQDRLLNAQTGEYVPVTIEPVSVEQLQIRGETVDAIRYSLDAGKLAMNLWYTPQRDWLALESTTKGGRLLRYELL